MNLRSSLFLCAFSLLTVVATVACGTEEDVGEDEGAFTSSSSKAKGSKGPTKTSEHVDAGDAGEHPAVDAGDNEASTDDGGDASDQ